MSEKINPCPNPKCKNDWMFPPTVDVWSSSYNVTGTHSVSCHICKTSGPVCESESSAIAAWNSISYVFQVLTKRPERMFQFVARCQPEPLPHIWLGTSLENNMAVYKRLEPMSFLGGRHWTTFASCEPLLERLEPMVTIDGSLYKWVEHFHWVIVGGESGQKCRPFDPDWAREIRDACDPTHTAFFMKQLGGHPDKREALASIPNDLRIREFPK